MSTSGVNSSTMSFSGVGSGFDVKGTVDQLIAVESNSQTLLKQQLSKHKTMVNAYQQLNSVFSTLKSSAEELSLGFNWRAKAATVQGDGVTANATNTATTGSFTFSVKSLAKSQTVVTGGTVSSLDTVVGNTGNYAGKTLSQVVDEVNKNSSTLGFTAAAVQVSPGNYKLQLQATKSGTEGAITANLNDITSSMGAFNTVQPAVNAELQVGTGANAYSITSSSNTVKDVLPGVTLNLTKADPAAQVTVTVGGDADAMASKVEAMVKAVNDAAKLINDNSNYDQGSKTGGVFLGSSVTRQLSANMNMAVTDIVGSSLKLGSNAGIQYNADGTYTFDKAKFTQAYKDNPEAVAALFVEGGTSSVSTGNSPGIAERLKKLATNATDSVSGLITTAIKGENNTVEDLNKGIAAWDDRLAQRRETLLTMFNAMDSAIQRFSSQGNWLAGQLKSLG